MQDIHIGDTSLLTLCHLRLACDVHIFVSGVVIFEVKDY